MKHLPETIIGAVAAGVLLLGLAGLTTVVRSDEGTPPTPTPNERVITDEEDPETRNCGIVDVPSPVYARGDDCDRLAQ